MVGNEVEITLDEFKEYMDLKGHFNSHSELMDKVISMSGLDFMDLCCMDLKECSIDDSDPRYDEYTFKFTLLKASKKNQHNSKKNNAQ